MSGQLASVHGRPAIAALLLIALASCAGGNHAASPQLDPVVAAGAWLPAPQAFAEQLRAGSVVEGLERDGCDYAESVAQRVTALDAVAQFSPAVTVAGGPAAELAYASYYFQFDEAPWERAIELSWASAPQQPFAAWLGLSYWAGERWEWYRAPVGEGPGGLLTLAAPGLSRYIRPLPEPSGASELLAVVVVTGPAEALPKPELARLRIGAALAGGGNWRMAGRDRRHTRRSAYPGPQTSHLRWSFATTGPGFSFKAPAVAANGAAYACSSNGIIHALDSQGKPRWSRPASSYYAHTVVAADGTLYQAHGAQNAEQIAHVLAYTPAGNLKWQVDLGEEIPQGIVVGPDGTVFVTSDSLYAISSVGIIKWRYTLDGDSLTSAPAAGSDGRVYFGVMDGGVFCLDAEGRELWTYDTNGWAIGVALDAQNNAYAAAAAGDLFAISAEGELRWVADAVQLGPGIPAVGPDGNVYAGMQLADSESASGYREALCAWAPDGELRYEAPTEFDLILPPVIAADGTAVLVSGARTGQVAAFNANGELRWEKNLGKHDLALALDRQSGTLLVTNESCFEALNLDGETLWSFTAGGHVDSEPVTAYDGSIYFTADDRTLYCLSPLGELQWSFFTAPQEFPATEFPPKMLAIDTDGTLYGISGNGLCSVPSNGQLQFHWGDAKTSPMLGDDGTIFAASKDVFYAYDPAGGVRWQQDISPCSWYLGLDVPAIDDDGLSYLVDNEDTLHAIQPDGVEKWQLELAAGPTCPPAIADDGRIYLVCGTGLLVVDPAGPTSRYVDLSAQLGEDSFLQGLAIGAGGTAYLGVIDPRCGVLAVHPDSGFQWRYGIEHPYSESVTTPVVDSDGAVYFADNSNLGQRLFCLSADGEQRWSCELNNRVAGSLALTADGALLVPCGDGNLYAFGD